MSSDLARSTWRTLEPIHGAIYFVPEAADEYAAGGLTEPRRGYFASRAAPMGAVAAEVVTATFYNFDPGLVTASISGVWDVVTPTQMVDARWRAVDRMLRARLLDDVDASERGRGVELIRVAADAACERPFGRPLFAGHASRDWPDDAHLQLWLAQTLLREYRGDGHIAAFVEADLDGCEARVLLGSSCEVPSKALRVTRQRTDDDWSAATERLQVRGWLDQDGELTDAGRAGRASIEAMTDRLAAMPYAALGADRCDELRTLARPWSRVMAEAIPGR